MTREQMYALLTEIAADAAGKLDAAGVATGGVVIAISLGSSVAIAGGVPEGERKVERLSEFGKSASETIVQWTTDTVEHIRRGEKGGARGIVH
jgi:hypothetical protein